jgi:hypothetical protein
VSRTCKEGRSSIASLAALTGGLASSNLGSKPSKPPFRVQAIERIAPAPRVMQIEPARGPTIIGAAGPAVCVFFTRILTALHVEEIKEDINKLKLRALNAFQELARLTGGWYALPERGKLAEGRYFTKEEADHPPGIEEIRLGTRP